MNCLVCGEIKFKDDFKNVMYFSTYKKRKMQWCRDCQKMYVNMKRIREKEEKYKSVELNYLVSFQ